MDAELVSEKRKRSSSSLAPSSITISSRSKSGIQLRNSSDRSPIDSTARLNQDSNLGRPESPRKRPKSRYGDPASSKGYVLFHTLTKDLRSRRVYSPKSDPTQNLGFEFGCNELQDKASEMGGSEIVSKKATIGEQTEKLAVGFPCKAQRIDYDSRSRGIDGWDEERAHIKPPPDAGMYAVPGEGKPSNGISQSEGCLREAFGPSADKKIDFETKSKSFIRPCSQRKVFRTPGSFSYRRLLPYLMDISKSNSSVPEINLTNLDKGLGERKLMVRCLSQSEEALKENCERDTISMDCQINHSDASQKLVLDYASSCDKPLLSDTITELPSITLVDGSSLPPMNGHAQNSDAGLSCNDQIMNNLDCNVSVLVEELQVVKDNVISPSSDDIEVVENVETEEADSASHLGKDNEVNQDSENSGQVGCEGMKDTDRLHPLKVEELSQLKERRGGDDGEVVNQVVDAKEECIQMTPPELVICSKPEVEGNGVNRADCILQDKDHCPGNLSNGIDHRNSGLDYNAKHDYNSKCQVSLKPRSRSKLFRNPGSFSYRRLLPFLMNIAKDNSDASVNDLKPEKDLEFLSLSASVSDPKPEKDLEFLPLSASVSDPKPEKDLEFPSLFASENQEIPLENSNGIRLEENQKGDSGTLPMTESTAASDSSKDSLSKLISPGHGTELQISINSQKEEQMQVEEAVSNLPSELETFPDISSSQISFNSKKEDLMQVEEAVPNIPIELVASPDISSSQISFNSHKEEQKQVEEVVPNISSELETSPDILSSADETSEPVTSLCSVDCEPSPRELAISTTTPNQLPVETEMNSSRSDLESSDGVKSAEADRLCSITIRHESPVSSGSPDIGLRKGILKRNPRGCRGICTCLNCASFKLHAERAFEFSTNQMEDTEEMVLELIKELSALRNVLEKSTGTADDHLLVPANQAKEACKKASEAEELAKNSLNQMNEDLNIHCRIPCVELPRVRFANSVEEHVIPRKIYRATRRDIRGRTRELQN